MKYTILTNETKVHNGVTLYRIQSLKDFSDVKAGDKGGWIEKESNLSQYGDAWIYGNAKVYDNAIVHDDAWVHDDAMVYGNAKIYDNAMVCGNAKVYDNAMVCGNAMAAESECKNWFFTKKKWRKQNDNRI